MFIEKKALSLIWALLMPLTALDAQLIPGGQPVDVGRLRGEFYDQMVEMVNEVMGSWQEAWRQAGAVPVQDSYFQDATLLQPGGLPLKGREEIEAFSEAALPVTSGFRTGMQDLEACEGFAYLSGYYAMDPKTANRGPNNGRHFTVIQQDGRRWRIRTQLFFPDSGTAPLPRLLEPELLEPLTNSQIQAGSRGESRFSAFGDAEFILLAFRDAWHRGDAADAATFFAEDAWVRLPHESAANMSDLSLEDRLKEGMERFGELLTVELDFDRRDRLSFTFGRYHAEGSDGADRPGHFIMVLRNAGSGWLIRSLAFS